MGKKSNKLSTKAGQARASSNFDGDFQRMFDNFAHNMMMSPFSRRVSDWHPFRRIESAAGMMTPDIDVTESDKDIRVTVELPGMEEKDIDVEIAGDRLTIRGEKEEKREETDKEYHVSERRYGSFQRTLTMPDTVDSAKVSAAVENGVLTIVLPRTNGAKEKARKIEVGKD